MEYSSPTTEPIRNIRDASDPLIHVMYQYLALKDIISLSSSCKLFYKIIHLNSTWKFLLERDFSIKNGSLEKYQVCKMIREWKNSIGEDSDEKIWKLIDIANYKLDIPRFEGIPLISTCERENDSCDGTLFKKRIFYLTQSLTTREHDMMCDTVKWLDEWENEDRIPSVIQLGGRNLGGKYRKDRKHLDHCRFIFGYCMEDETWRFFPNWKSLKDFDYNISDFMTYKGCKDESWHNNQVLVDRIRPIAAKMENFFTMDTVMNVDEKFIPDIKLQLPFDENDIVLGKRHVR